MHQLRRHPQASIDNLAARLPATRPETARARLRSGTEAAHEALHEAEPFALIAAGQLDRAGYARLLAALARFHGALNPAIDVAAAELGDDDVALAARHRRDLLAADLAALGKAGRSEPTPVTPRAGAWSVGCLYTALGSTLGGKVIHRQLGYLCAGDDGRRFFAGSRDDGARWRSFCAALNVYGAEPTREPALIAGARFAFSHFAACLRE